MLLVWLNFVPFDIRVVKSTVLNTKLFLSSVIFGQLFLHR